MYPKVLAAALSLTLLAAVTGAAVTDPPPPKLPSATEVAAVARASARAAGAVGQRLARTSSIPVNDALLAEHPELATVPVAAPVEDNSKYAHALTGKTFPKLRANARVAATNIKFSPISATASFVKATKSTFTLNGKTIYPAGTNWYNMVRHQEFTQAQIRSALQIHWNNGVRLIRTFGFANGFDDKSILSPFQPSVGKFNEVALKHYDMVLNECAKVGIRLVLAMVNHEIEGGGSKWYVDQTLGKTHFREEFYTNIRPRNAYRNWLNKIVRRRNTVNGRLYLSDPTIFAWELGNEMHTTDNYENDVLKVAPGTIVYNWEVEMSKYFKLTLKVKQLVTNGNEGYRVSGKYDPYARIDYPFLNWMNTGLKGENFNRNCYIKYLDYCTIHVYAKNLGLAPESHTFVNDFFIGERARLAKAAGKPLMLEEFGGPRDYVNRETLFASVLSAANAYKLAGILVWEVYAAYGDDSGYDFKYEQAGGKNLVKEFNWQRTNRVKKLASPFPFVCKCTDEAPSTDHTCAQQISFGPDKCCQAWMQVGSKKSPTGFCDISCGRCLCKGGQSSCPTKSAIMA